MRSHVRDAGDDGADVGCHPRSRGQKVGDSYCVAVRPYSPFIITENILVKGHSKGRLVTRMIVGWLTASLFTLKGALLLADMKDFCLVSMRAWASLGLSNTDFRMVLTLRGVSV